MIQQLDPVRMAIKQENNVGMGSDLMAPGQTHIGSPDAVSPYVDSTTPYSSRLTPPGSGNDYFSSSSGRQQPEDLLNGKLLIKVINATVDLATAFPINADNNNYYCECSPQ